LESIVLAILEDWLIADSKCYTITSSHYEPLLHRLRHRRYLVEESLSNTKLAPSKTKMRLCFSVAKQKLKMRYQCNQHHISTKSSPNHGEFTEGDCCWPCCYRQTKATSSFGFRVVGTFAISPFGTKSNDRTSDRRDILSKHLYCCFVQCSSFVDNGGGTAFYSNKC
jgi:hypothetical protein